MVVLKALKESMTAREVKYVEVLQKALEDKVTPQSLEKTGFFDEGSGSVKSTSSQLTIANNIEFVRIFAVEVMSTKLNIKNINGETILDWIMNNPKTIWLRCQTGGTSPRFNALRYMYLIMRHLKLIVEDRDSPGEWEKVRVEAYDVEQREVSDRVSRLKVNDVSWNLLYGIFTQLPVGSSPRLWFAMMLLNPPMRDELKSLAYNSTPTDSGWRCRGIISEDKIVLYDTKMTNRSGGKQLVIPMSSMAKKELMAFVKVTGVKSGEWIFKRRMDGYELKQPLKEWSSINLSTFTPKLLKVDVNNTDFSWITANVFRRAFCREVLPVVWLKHSAAIMKKLNSFMGHSLDAVEYYAVAADKKGSPLDKQIGPIVKSVPGPSVMYKVIESMVGSLNIQG